MRVNPVLCQNSALFEIDRLCLLFIHPRAPNLISLRSAGTCDPQKKKTGQKQLTMAGLKRAINAGSIFCGAQLSC